jgi:anti-sigma factor (TIGR02949 family)
VSCKLTTRFVPGYLDGELDLSRTIEMETHLQVCAECARELQKQQALRAALQRGSLAFAAPESLRARIRTSLLAAVTAPAANSAPAASPTAVPVQRSIPERRAEWSVFQFLRWASAFAVLALCTVVAWQLVPGLHGPTNDQQLAAEIFTSHVRSLEANHLMDVVSTDQHTVKPWFDGKLDFSPPVEDLASDGFPLVGGRLDYLEGHQVAALIYQRRKHIINVYVWPDAAGSAAAPDAAKTLQPRQGYNMIRWSGGGFQFWAISDVSSADLEEFVRVLRTHSGVQSK